MVEVTAGERNEVKRVSRSVEGREASVGMARDEIDASASHFFYGHSTTIKG